MTPSRTEDPVGQASRPVWTGQEACPTRLLRKEFHPFQASGKEFVYLVPSAAVFELDDLASAVLARLAESPIARGELVEELSARFSEGELQETVTELLRVQAIGEDGPIDRQAGMPVPQKVLPIGAQVGAAAGMPIPLTTMVLNVTNQCNLSCTYCYEYGEDKIVDTENGKKPKFMSEETARESVDFMLREAGANKIAHLTFFGGETLMNFPVLKSAMSYARQRAAETGKQVDFSLTTNATLLRPEIIEFLAENRVGVTISIDGPKEMQDQFRVFSNGKGSYDIVAPKIKELLKRHRSRPIGPRVTLTSQTLDIRKIYKHEVCDRGIGFRCHAGAVPRARCRLSGGSARKQASRIFER